MGKKRWWCRQSISKGQAKKQCDQVAEEEKNEFLFNSYTLPVFKETFFAPIPY